MNKKLSTKSALRLATIPVASAGVLIVGGSGIADHAIDSLPELLGSSVMSDTVTQYVKHLIGSTTAHATGTNRVITNNDVEVVNGVTAIKMDNFDHDKNTLAAFAWDYAGKSSVEVIKGHKFQLVADPTTNGATGNASEGSFDPGHGYQYSGSTIQGQINWLTGWNNVISGLNLDSTIQGLKNNTNGKNSDLPASSTTYTSDPGDSYRITNVGRLLGTGADLAHANGDVLDMIVTIVDVDNGIKTSEGFGWNTAEGGQGGGIGGGTFVGSWNPAIAFGKTDSPAVSNAIGIYNLYTYDANMDIKFVKHGTNTEVPITTLNYWADIDATQSMYENFTNSAYGFMGSNLSLGEGNIVHTKSTTDDDSTDDRNAYLGISSGVSHFNYHYHQQNTQDGYNNTGQLWHEDGIFSALFGRSAKYEMQFNIRKPLPNPKQPDIVKNVEGKGAVNNNTNRPADITLGNTVRNNGDAVGYLSKSYFGSTGDDKQAAGIGTDYSNDEGWLTTAVGNKTKDADITKATITYDVNAYLDSSWNAANFNPKLHFTDDLASNHLKATAVGVRMPDGSVKDVSADAIKNSGASVDYTVSGSKSGDYTLIVKASPTDYQVKYPNTAKVSTDFTQRYDDGTAADADWTGAGKPAWAGNLLATNSVQVFPRVPLPTAPDVVKNVSGADVTAVNGYTKDGYNVKADDKLDSATSYEGYYGKPGEATTVGDEIVWTPQMNFDSTWSYTDASGSHSYNPQIRLQDTIQAGLQIKSIEVLVNGVSKGMLPTSAWTGNKIDYTWDGTGVGANAKVKFKITTTVTDGWRGKFINGATLSVTGLRGVAEFTDGRSSVVNGKESTVATPTNFQNLQTNTVSVISDQQPEQPVKNVMPSGTNSVKKLSGYVKYDHKADDNLATAEGVLQKRNGQYEWVVTQYLNDYSNATGTTLTLDVMDDISGQGRLTSAGAAYVRVGNSNTVAELSGNAAGLAVPKIAESGADNAKVYHVTGIDNKTRAVEIHIPVKLADKSAVVSNLDMMSNQASTKVTVDSLPTNAPGATSTNTTNQVGVVIPASDTVKNESVINSKDLAGKATPDQATRYTVGNTDGVTVIGEGNVWQNQQAKVADVKQTGTDTSDKSGLDLTATDTRPQIVWALDQQFGSGADATGSKGNLQQTLTIADVLDPEVALGYMDTKGNFVAGTSNDGKSVIVYGVTADGKMVDETKNFDVKVSGVNGSITGGTTNNDMYAGQPLDNISQQRLDLTAKDAAGFRQKYVSYHVEVLTVAHGGMIASSKIGNQFTSNIVWPTFNNTYTSNYVNVDRPKPADSLEPVKVQRDDDEFGNRKYTQGTKLGDVTADDKSLQNGIDNFGDVSLENPNTPVSFFAGSNVPADRTSNYKSYTITDDVNAAFEEQSVVGVYDVTEAIKQAGIDPAKNDDVTAMLSAMYAKGNLSKTGSGVHDVSANFTVTANGKAVAFGTLQQPSGNKPIHWEVSAKPAVLSQNSFYEDGLYITQGANHMYGQNPLNGRYYVTLINAQPAGFNNDTLDIPNQASIIVDGGDHPGTKVTPWTVTHVNPPKDPAVSKTTIDKAPAIDGQTIDDKGALTEGKTGDKSSGIVYSHEDALKGDEDGTSSDIDGDKKNTLTSTREVTRATVNYTIPYVFDNVYSSWEGNDHNFRVAGPSGKFDTKADITIKGTSAISKVNGLTIDLTADRSQGGLMLAKMTTEKYAMQAVYLDASNNGQTGDPVAMQVIPLPSGWDTYDAGQKSDFLKQYADNLTKQLKEDGAGRDWDNISKNSTFKIQTWDSSSIKVTGNTPADKLASVVKTDAGKAVIGYMNYLAAHKQATSVVMVKDFTMTGDNAGATLVAPDNVLTYGSVFYGTNIQQLFDWYYNGNNTTDIDVRNTATMSIDHRDTESNPVDTVVPAVKQPKIEKHEAPTAIGSITKGGSDGQSTGDNDGGKAQALSTLNQVATDATPNSKADGTEDMTVGRLEKYTYGFKATVPGISLSGFSIKDTGFRTDVLNNPDKLRVLLDDGTDVSADFNFGYDAKGLPFASTKSPKIADTYRGVNVWLILDGVSVKKDANLDKYADKNKTGDVTGYTIPDTGALQYSALDPKNPANGYDPADPDHSVDSNIVNVHLYVPKDPQKFVSVDNGQNWSQDTEHLKDHGDSYMWKTVYGNVNSKYLKHVTFTDYLESSQTVDDVKILYTSADGKTVDKDVTAQGTVKTTVMDSPLVDNAKVVKYTWSANDSFSFDGDFQMVVENATLGEPSADEVPYLVNDGKGLLGFGSDKTVVKVPNIAQEEYTDETGENVSKNTNVPMVEIPQGDVADVPQKFIDVLDGGAIAINGQGYLTGHGDDDSDQVDTPKAGKVTVDATVTLTNPVGETKTQVLKDIDVTDAYNNALTTPDLTKDVMTQALQVVVDKVAADKGYIVGKTLTTGEKVTSIVMGPLQIVSVEDQAAADKVAPSGQAIDLKLLGGADSALSLSDAQKAGTYWSVAVYNIGASASDKPLAGLVVTGKDDAELKDNLTKLLADKHYDDATKFQYYVQAVTTTDKSQKTTSLTKLQMMTQTVHYTVTSVDGKVTKATYNLTWPWMDNGHKLTADELDVITTTKGRSALTDKFGHISWDANTGLNGTINGGGFITVTGWR